MLQWYLCRYSLSGMPWLVPIVNELLAAVAQEKEKKGEKNEGAETHTGAVDS